jgi:8-oxo-dGTP pyrophosphatase MutT (NUDIX family)
MRNQISQTCKFFQNWKFNSKIVFESDWFKLLKNKSFYTVEYNEKQVVVLPVMRGNLIIMAKVKRSILGDSTWELPAGGIKKKEKLREGALMELKEETGIGISNTSRLKDELSIVVCPNRLPMFPSIFSIEISKEEYEHRVPHDEEVDYISCFSLSKIVKMIENGEIFTSLTISILSRYLLSKKVIV